MATPIPKNLAPFTLQEILAVTGGEALTSGEAAAVGVSTDTRSVSVGNLFVALVGGRHDGHAHAVRAAELGASVLLVSRRMEAPDGVAVVQVADTLQALGALGRAHRRRWEARSARPRVVVGITGSAGKTTTRVATAAGLSAAGFEVHASEGNLNNAVGIPMVLLGLEERHEAAVVEVGTSSRGEIAYGCSLVEPHVGVITLVAAAHTENIGAISDVAVEKGAMFASLARDGVAVANADDGRVRGQLLRCGARDWITYGEGPGADVQVIKRQPEGLDWSRLRVRLRGRARVAGVDELELRTPLLGVAGSYATAAAIATVLAAAPDRLSAEALQGVFEGLRGEEGRLRTVRLASGAVALDDSYNANRASVVASLRTAAELARSEGRRLVAVLGEMRELGALSADEHRIVGEEAARQGAAVVVAVSGDAAEIARAASSSTPGPEVVFVENAARAIDVVAALIRPGDLVLVKGSRGVNLDTVVRALAQAPEPSR